MGKGKILKVDIVRPLKNNKLIVFIITYVFISTDNLLPEGRDSR